MTRGGRAFTLSSQQLSVCPAGRASGACPYGYRNDSAGGMASSANAVAEKGDTAAAAPGDERPEPPSPPEPSASSDASATASSGSDGAVDSAMPALPGGGPRSAPDMSHSAKFAGQIESKGIPMAQLAVRNTCLNDA